MFWEFGSLTMRLQESSWGLIGRKELTPSGPTLWVSLWPAAPFSAGSSATCYTKSCGMDMQMWEESWFCSSEVLMLIQPESDWTINSGESFPNGCIPWLGLISDFYVKACPHCWFCLPLQVLQDCMRHHSSIVEIGKLWVSPSFCNFENEFREILNLFLGLTLSGLCSGQPPWQVWTAGGSLHQAALYKDGVSHKGTGLFCHNSNTLSALWLEMSWNPKCFTAPTNPTKPGGDRWSPGARCRNRHQ